MKKILIVFGLITCLFIIYTLSRLENKTYLNMTDDLLTKQAKISADIKKYQQANYTIDDPKIILNPYLISPLSALIIFNTPNKTRVEVLVNDYLIGSIEDSKFTIPIIYLKEDYENKITIKNSTNKYNYIIKTDKISDVATKVKGDNISNILISSPDLKHSIIDPEGSLIWYLNLDTQGFIEPTNNNTFLIGTEEHIIENNIQTFSGIYELDYLGRIIKRIDSKLKYHHAISMYQDNLAFVLGSKGDVPLNVLYILDLDTGSILDSIDFYEYLTNYNPLISEYLQSLPHGLGINSFSYLNDRIIISMRDIDTILSLNYQTKELEFIISSDKQIQKNFSKYIIKTSEEILGAHDVKFLSDTTISLYNNAYSHNTKKHKTASGLVLELKDNRAKVIKKYQNAKKYSYAYGSIDEKTQTLVNYSYMYANESDIKNNEVYTDLIIYKNQKKMATINIASPIYKAAFYSLLSVANYQVSDYIYLNNYDNLESFSLNQTKPLNNIFRITNNSLETTISNDHFDSLTITFKSKKHTYTFPYLNTKTYFSIEAGIYDLYIKMDDKTYKIDGKVHIS